MFKMLLIQSTCVLKEGVENSNSFANTVKRQGRFILETIIESQISFVKLDKYDVVILNSVSNLCLKTVEKQKYFQKWVNNGGTLLCCNNSINAFQDKEFTGGSVENLVSLREELLLSSCDHYITKRISEIRISDQVYILDTKSDQDIQVLFHTTWQGKEKTVIYNKKYGSGYFGYIGTGKALSTWTDELFQKLICRMASFDVGYTPRYKELGFGILGYGPNFRMGLEHSKWINQADGLSAVAICDNDPARIEAARKEIPDLKGYFTNFDDMLSMDEVDVVINILPHNLHAPLTIKALEAGKHVICEKPFCITVEEAESMMELAVKKDLLLSVYHNRRWDPDYRIIQKIIQNGVIGEVFHISAASGSYGHPGHWWRSDPVISGGIMYDWGAHFLDWILNLVPGQVTQIIGDTQKRVWNSVKNDDYGFVWMRFENGTTADLEISYISYLKKNRWSIMGTKGSIEMANGKDEIKLTVETTGIKNESFIKVPVLEKSGAVYYRNIADHMLSGDALGVTAQDAKRVIGILEGIKISNNKGTSISPLEGCE